MMKNAKSTHENWHDPNDAPKLTKDWVSEADAYDGKTLVRRGRPKLAQTKRHISLTLDQDVIDSFKATGPGWQARVNEALRKAASISMLK
jgi:uncharacterized protein (DUF4415 family)